MGWDGKENGVKFDLEVGPPLSLPKTLQNDQATTFCRVFAWLSVLVVICWIVTVIVSIVYWSKYYIDVMQPATEKLNAFQLAAEVCRGIQYDCKMSLSPEAYESEKYDIEHVFSGHSMHSWTIQVAVINLWVAIIIAGISCAICGCMCMLGGV
jgi:hypothetical protein